jgi:DNA-binding NarL/FixJ family response regulator
MEAQAPSAPIRILLVGDCPLVRRGFSELLSNAAGIEVVGTAADAVEASQFSDAGVDLVIVGAVSCAPDLHALRAIVASRLETPLLVLGRESDPALVQAVLDAGALGYMSLGEASEADLLEAVTAVAARNRYVSATPPATVTPDAAAPLTDRLTARERQVLTLIAGGRSNREIATMLGLSTNTIALDVRRTAGLVLFAVRHGLVQADA